MKWSYGITTVPERMEGHLLNTIRSLGNGGFGSPRLFVDGWYGMPRFHGLPVTARESPIRIVGNWMTSMWELFVREPAADRFALFQDDILSVRNLREYLERVPYPNSGYLNLYTFPENTTREHRSGWSLSGMHGMGALGLVFDRHAVTHLFQSGHIARKPLDVASKRSWKAMDGGIHDGLKAFGIREYVHVPSLLQHVGSDKSILGNLPGGRPYGGVSSFPGESFDALTFLSVPAPPPQEAPREPDIVDQALELLGENKERIEAWLGEDCGGCEASHRKRVKIGAWASRVLRGNTADAEKFLNRILED